MWNIRKSLALQAWFQFGEQEKVQGVKYLGFTVDDNLPVGRELLHQKRGVRYRALSWSKVRWMFWRQSVCGTNRKQNLRLSKSSVTVRSGPSHDYFPYRQLAFALSHYGLNVPPLSVHCPGYVQLQWRACNSLGHAHRGISTFFVNGYPAFRESLLSFLYFPSLK